MKPVYSIILPVRNEALSLPRLYLEIKKVLAGKNYEIIAVDDSSTDSSKQILHRLAPIFPESRIIALKNHPGKWVALRTGIEVSRGQVVIIMDSDLQDDPNELPKLLKKFKAGYDIVSGARVNRRDSFYKILITRLGNQLISILTGHKFTDFSSPFKIYQRGALGKLPKEGDLLRYTLLFAEELGLKIAEVPVLHRPRLYGQSKFGLRKYLRIIYDLFLILLLFTGSGGLTTGSNQRKSSK